MSKAGQCSNNGQRSINGVLVVDKPQGMTSFAVVKRVRHNLGVRKAGHTGTLDPLATGVLPICLGEATKIAGLLLAEDKTYQARVLLGLETDTFDITGQILRRADPAGVSQLDLEQALVTFRGPQQQTPPAFSAIRINGRRAYDMARQGQAVELKSRPVVIQRLELVDWEPPHLSLHLECSKGTYVRSLVADLGQVLGCGATLEALRRLRSGNFDIAQSVPIPSPQDDRTTEPPRLISIDQALAHVPQLDLSPEDAARLCQGQFIKSTLGFVEPLLRVHSQGCLVALAYSTGEEIRPKRVLMEGGPS